MPSSQRPGPSDADVWRELGTRLNKRFAFVKMIKMDYNEIIESLQPLLLMHSCKGKTKSLKQKYCSQRQIRFPFWWPEKVDHNSIQNLQALDFFFFLISFTFLIKSKKQTKKYIDVLNRTSLCKGLTKQINTGPDKRNGAANSNMIYNEAFIYVCIYYIWMCGYMCVHLCTYKYVNICLHMSHTHIYIYTDLFRLKSKALFTMNRLKPLIQNITVSGYISIYGANITIHIFPCLLRSVWLA